MENPLTKHGFAEGQPPAESPRSLTDQKWRQLAQALHCARSGSLSLQQAEDLYRAAPLDPLPEEAIKSLVRSVEQRAADWQSQRLVIGQLSCGNESLSFRLHLTPGTMELAVLTEPAGHTSEGTVTEYLVRVDSLNVDTRQIRYPRPAECQQNARDSYVVWQDGRGEEAWTVDHAIGCDRLEDLRADPQPWDWPLQVGAFVTPPTEARPIESNPSTAESPVGQSDIDSST